LTFIFILFYREKGDYPVSVALYFRFLLYVLITSDTATARPGNQRRKETKTGKKKKHPRRFFEPIDQYPLDPCVPSLPTVSILRQYAET
jgi:hypothetical protein